MFHVGVLSTSLDGGAELLRQVRSLGAGVNQPELTLSCAPLGDGVRPWQREDGDTVRSQLVLSSARLRQAGAHFFVCADDTAYVPLATVDHELALPGVHVAPVVAGAAQRLGVARVGVLGTRWTLGGSQYAAELEPMGIEALSLSLKDETTLHSIIFDEVARGRVSFSSRDIVLRLIDSLRLRGCQAVVLGCHELRVLATPANSSLPLLDATALLAEAAVSVAVGETPLPSWRGGPTPTATPVEADSAIG